MDPNATLRELREAIAAAYAAIDDDDDSVAWEDLLIAVTEHAENLDEWLTRGGFLPSAWDRAADNTARALDGE